MNTSTLKGNIVDVHNERIFFGEIRFDSRIIDIQEISPITDPKVPYLMPGFIDSHVHIESSMLVPSEFARLAVIHGTVSTVSDPHEIANVCGMDGVQFMIDNGRSVNFKFYFGAPSCVPATKFETAGSILDANEVSTLLQRPEIRYLSEMMNFPGVVNGDEEVIKKISAAAEAGKPVDGHAPGLSGEPLRKYVAAGISTDHECFSSLEASEKLSLGMKIIIREGSAAKNFDALIDLLPLHASHMMFCSDDKHPDSLVNGHINELCRRAADKGIRVFDILKAACLNPVSHYQLDVGTLRVNDPADFIIVEDLASFNVVKTFINGACVAENGKSILTSQPVIPINNFREREIIVQDITARATDHLVNNQLPVIEALDGQLITNKLIVEPRLHEGSVLTDIDHDILKVVVVNRYTDVAPSVAFIKNFGLKNGAIASSVAHDSHNVIAVGTSDDYIVNAINLLMKRHGGISCVSNEIIKVLPLPIAGLMSDQDGFEVAALYTEMDQLAKSLGSSLSAPFMTLSFMALLVIPSLKLSDLGLFDGDTFRFVHETSHKHNH